MSTKFIAGFAAATFALVASAQDTPASGSSDAGSAPADASAAPAPNPADLKPRPSEMAPLAAHSLLLAITRAGDHFVAVGDRGDILTSTNGDTWEQVQSPVHATLTTVVFTDGNNGWAAGHDASILHTADGGKTWQLQNFKPQDTKPVLAMLPLDAQHVIATGAYGLYLETTDGGKTWNAVDNALAQGSRHLNSLTKLGDGELFLAGETGTIAVSKDGHQWTPLKLPYDGSLFGALPRGDKGALVYGLRGNVYMTDDVHTNQWKKVDTKTVASFFGGTMIAGGDAVLVGADGEVVRISPAGAVSNARVAADEHTLGSGTLSGVLPRDGELLVVGELGIGKLKVAGAQAPATPAPAAAESAPPPATAEATPAPASAAPAAPAPAPKVAHAAPKVAAAAESAPAPSRKAATSNPNPPRDGADVTLGKTLSLYSRPTDKTTAVATLRPGTVAKLKSHIANPTGVWWYVLSKNGSGWATEADLKASL